MGRLRWKSKCHRKVGQPWMSSANQGPPTISSVPQTGQQPSTVTLKIMSGSERIYISSFNCIGYWCQVSSATQTKKVARFVKHSRSFTHLYESSRLFAQRTTLVNFC